MVGFFKRNPNSSSQAVKQKESFSRIDNWVNFFTGMGIRGRDKNMGTCFKPSYRFGPQELDEIYRSDGMTRRVIDCVAEEMVRQGWDIENDPDAMVNVKLEELNINCILMNMIRWARLYGGSLGVLGVADGRALDQPLDKNNISDLKWIHVFDRFSVSSATGVVDGDLSSPNYGKPIVYMVNDPISSQTFHVHYTRTIRCDWNELVPRWSRSNDSWADPLMQTIYEELKNYSTAFANCGIIIHDFVNYVLKIPGLAGILASEGCSKNAEARADILNMSKSSLNTMIIDAEEEYQKITTNINGISDLLDRFMLALSSVTGIPVTLLFGRSPAGLNATGENDIRNFYDMIKQKQEGKLKPMLEKIIEIIFLSKNGFYKGQEPKDWKICFTPLWQNTEEQEASIRKTIAETDAIYIDRGVLDPTEVAVSRFGGSIWSMNTEIDVENRESGFKQEDIDELFPDGTTSPTVSESKVEETP